ncbi:MAG: hypothetical protein HY287_03730 [Planctomycetes bacterium]|nr:hypothetical protein [Planctomycetota bacterium]MBI3833422.1 hypothetical protein [Planctomycetota bacterium]
MLLRLLSCLALACVATAPTGCIVSGSPNATGNLAPLVDAKAVAVAEQVGGVAGFGGTMMDGYFNHAEQQIHFDSANDLADSNAHMTIAMRNNSTQTCTFHVAYLASHMGLDDQTEDAIVPAGGQTTIEIPCAEMVGMGSLETPGAVACQLANGQTVDNVMSVPAFLGLDYQCGQMYQFMLTPDTNDLDNDGDTKELIVQSDAMRMHSLDGGPTGHMHGNGQGMMGSHMGQP